MAAAAPRIFCITGASSGFGAALTRRFAAEGHRVVAVARRGDRLDALSAEYGERILPVVLDVRARADVERVLTSLPADFAAVDCLVNNAGLALGMAAVPAASVDDWETMIDTNCKGLMYATQALLPGMLERKRGHIVNIGSVAGSHAYVGGNVYGASKAFVHQFSANLRSDLHGTGVRVTCIEPGLCSGTEFSDVRFHGDTARAAAVYTGMQPLMAEDVADAVQWAVSVPAHVNVNRIELMPVAQSLAGFQVARST
jgi:3-hydroxy acid dehydrogenase / malonic semialdehyde reductase